MKTDSGIDPLRPASIEDLKQLIDIYKQSLPQSVQFVSLLQNILHTVTTLSDADKEQLSHRLLKTVYIPNNEHGNQFATFIAISREKDPFILLHTLEAFPIELTDALRKTSYINWDIKYTFVTGDRSDVRENLSQILKEHNLLENKSDFINYWIAQNEAAALSFVVPNDVELKPLQPQHAKQLNEWWPNRYATSQKYFESAINHYGGFGLFDKTSKDHLYTVPDRNNRGYGSTLAKAMTKHIATKFKQDVHTCVAESNEKPFRLFEKLGYRAVNRTEWVITS